MRMMFVAFVLASVAAVGVLSASAFNYANLSTRATDATVVADYNGYLSIGAYDVDYACYVNYSGGTTGQVVINWNGGTSCAAAANGTGVNPGSIYYFHDVLRLTNKGTKTLTHVWLNMTDTTIMLNKNTAAGAMSWTDTYAQNVDLSTNLAPGQSWYIGFKIDASGQASGTTLTKTMTIKAQSTP